MSQRSRSEIEQEVEEIALEVQEIDSYMTIEAARATVYEEIPELFDEYRAAPVEMPAQPVEKSQPEPTLGEVIHEAVKKKPAQRAWTEWPGKSLEQLEYETCTTPAGERLWELHRSPEGQLPISKVEQRIRKSGSSDDPWAILARWRGE